MAETLYKDPQEAQRKLFYGSVIVALAALVLSLLYSPPMGDTFWWLLLAAWALLFVSSVMAGLRLAREAKSGQPAIWLGRIQFCSLILGLSCNLVFCGANYVERVLYGPPPDACSPDDDQDDANSCSQYAQSDRAPDESGAVIGV